MWRELDDLLNLSRMNKYNSVSKLIINNKELTDDKNIANALNKLSR